VADADIPSLSMERATALLAEGELELLQHVPWSSNATFLAIVRNDESEVHAVYKPRRGERPLWDFPAGTLCQREMAAFVVSQALGWALVPPTVLRDGPHGFGAVQVFIPHDPDQHYLALEAPDADTVQRIVAFDVVINNADRKSGHVLLSDDGALWAIDHGVSFHVEPKLRTVIWDLAGQALPEDVADDLAAFAADLRTDGGGAFLSPLLSDAEIEALARRADDLVMVGRYPNVDPQRRVVPWPPV
jgi:uncharacterized repeat protein (TIGR03843 family)